jgi:hypothetical protein
MEVALRRSYGFAFSPPLNRWGMQGLGQTCGDGTAEGEALCFAPAVAVSTDPNPVDTSSGSLYSQLIAAGVNPVDAEAYLTTGQLPAGSTGPVAAALTVVDSSGITWHCDANGNCCDPSLNCQVGPPTTNTAAQASVASQVAALAKVSQGVYGAASAATIATQAAQIAAAVARAVAPTPGTSNCPAGYVYGAPGASVSIAPGIVTAGTGKCLPSTVSAGILPGVSNSTLAIGVAAVVLLMLMGKRR